MPNPAYPIRAVRRGVLAIAIAIAAAASLPVAPAAAQCDYGWLPGMPGVGLTREVERLAVLDPDGPGPAPEQLIVASDGLLRAGGVAVNGMAIYESGVWRPMGAGLDYVLDLIVFDADAGGPGPAEVYAAGVFDDPPGNVARWDGEAWRPLGIGVNAVAKSFTVFDFDGDGPQPPQLVVGGQFTAAGGAPANYVARWDGQAWHPIGAGIPYSGQTWVWALTSFDFDGDGPNPPELVAGGRFDFPGSPWIRNVARFNGSEWVGVGNHNLPSGHIRAMASFDPDGAAGPQPAQLYVGGGLRRLDGAAWSQVGEFNSGSVLALEVLDIDGPGPLPESLIVGGMFSFESGGRLIRNLARWDGAEWFPIEPACSATVTSLAMFDPDGAGRRLAVGGPSGVLFGLIFQRVGLWSPSGWEVLGSGFSHAVSRLAAFDPDGPGPAPADLIAGGSFTIIGDLRVTRLARWDGASWLAVGPGVGAAPRGIALHDPDEDGPAPPRLVVGGPFRYAGGLTVNFVAAWDGDAWSAYGEGLDDSFNQDPESLVSHDPDGDGPEPERVYIASGNSVKFWDGQAWQTLGGPLTSGQVLRVYSHDPDGPGPQPPLLVAGGNFNLALGGAFDRVAMWDPAAGGGQGAWVQMGAGFDSAPLAFASWDPDGPGPEDAQLVAAGNFSLSGATPVSRIARWDGASWLPFGDGLAAGGQAAAAFDIDGPGPLPPSVITCGRTAAMAEGEHTLLRWDEPAQQWVSFGGLFDGTVAALFAYDRDGPDGPEEPQLIAGGEFGLVDGRPSAYLARWGNTSAPRLLAQPGDTQARSGETVALAVDAAGDPPLAYRWRRDGADLADGPTPHGSVIAGAATPTLTITGARVADAGAYAATVSSDCGEVTTAAAALSVVCAADYDGDESVNSNDISAFLAAWLGSIQNGTLEADFNHDLVVNSNDISVFLAAWLDALQSGC